MPNILILESGVGTLFSVSLTLSGGGWNGITGVESVQASAMTLPLGSITQVRFRFTASASESFTITNAYVEHRASSGNVYDFVTIPVQILFGGSASKVVGAGTSEWSDWVPFAYDKSTDLLVAFYCNGGASSDAVKYSTGVTGVSDHEKIANDAATVDKTGYSTNTGTIALLDRIESDGF